MKRTIASIGLVAVGVSSLQAQYAPGLTQQERVKPVTLSGSLRGFYDDNYLNQQDVAKQSSWGLEASPSISYNKSTPTTLVGADLTYDLKHYARPNINDQSVQANVKLDHQFTERYKLKVYDSFAVAQEPEVIEQAVQATPFRTKGSNIRNTGSFDFLAGMTSTLDLEANYVNSVYAYDEAVRATQLNRMEHLAGLSLRYKVLKETTAVLGYNFGDISYSDRLLDPGVSPIESNIRNNRSHFALAGVDQRFSTTFMASLRAGAQFFDYYKVDQTQTSPYVDAQLSYTYLPGDNLQVGVKHLHNATDVIGFNALIVNGHPDLVLDAEATAAYVRLTHKLNFISPNLVAGAMGSFQHSVFNGGGVDINDKSEDFYIANGNLTYAFNPNVGLELGYTYSQLTSELPFRAFERNRAYVGIRATY